MTNVAFCFYCRSEVIADEGKTRAKCSKCGTTTPCTEHRVRIDWPDVVRGLKYARLLARGQIEPENIPEVVNA